MTLLIKAEDGFARLITIYLDGVDVTERCTEALSGLRGRVQLLLDVNDSRKIEQRVGHVTFEIREDVPQDIISGFNKYMQLRHSIRKEIEKEYTESV